MEPCGSDWWCSTLCFAVWLNTITTKVSSHFLKFQINHWVAALLTVHCWRWFVAGGGELRVTEVVTAAGGAGAATGAGLGEEAGEGGPQGRSGGPAGHQRDPGDRGPRLGASWRPGIRWDVGRMARASCSPAWASWWGCSVSADLSSSLSTLEVSLEGGGCRVVGGVRFFYCKKTNNGKQREKKMSKLYTFGHTSIKA